MQYNEAEGWTYKSFVNNLKRIDYSAFNALDNHGQRTIELQTAAQSPTSLIRPGGRNYNLFSGVGNGASPSESPTLQDHPPRLRAAQLHLGPQSRSGCAAAEPCLPEHRRPAAGQPGQSPQPRRPPVRTRPAPPQAACSLLLQGSTRADLPAAAASCRSCPVHHQPHPPLSCSHPLPRLLTAADRTPRSRTSRAQPAMAISAPHMVDPHGVPYGVDPHVRCPPTSTFCCCCRRCRRRCRRCCSSIRAPPQCGLRALGWMGGHCRCTAPSAGRRRTGRTASSGRTRSGL